eukprot:gene6652-3314_t
MNPRSTWPSCDTSTLTPLEASFPMASAWVAQEAGTGTTTDSKPALGNVRASTSSGKRKSGTLPGPSRTLPSGEPAPNIVIEYLRGTRVMWRRDLADVEDDMETRYLQAARSNFEFTLMVPGRGAIEGVLWYFPYENDSETVPIDPSLGAYRQSGANLQGLTQAGGGGEKGYGGHTQMTLMPVSQMRGRGPTQMAKMLPQHFMSLTSIKFLISM